MDEFSNFVVSVTLNPEVSSEFLGCFILRLSISKSVCTAFNFNIGFLQSYGILSLALLYIRLHTYSTY